MERLCAHCQQWIGVAPRKGLCRACYSYWWKYKRPRPEYLFSMSPRLCRACGNLRTGSQSKFLCLACYMKQWRRRRKSTVMYDAQGNPWTQLPLPEA